MKLLIFLSIISIVNCVNNITVFSNNTIYLAHTSNCLIYKLTKNNNSYTNKEIVGKNGFFGNVNSLSGSESLIKYPRNIIKNKAETELFFIDDNKLLKNIKIQSDSIIGTIIESLPIINPLTNIYSNTSLSYNYASSFEPNKYIYFADSTSLYKIYLNSTSPTEKSLSLLSENHKFVNISFYNNVLYYGYKNTITNNFFIKKSNSFHMFDIDLDQELMKFTMNGSTTTYLNNINSFTISENSLIVTSGNIIKLFDIISFNPTSISNFVFNTEKTISSQINRYTALIDYKAIYNDDKINIIIGRSTNGNFYKINTSSLEVTNSSDSIVNMKTNFSITVRTYPSDITISDNIIYNNRYLANTENIILYFNPFTSNIQKIKCVNSEYRTTGFNFKLNNIQKNFTNIVDIAINNLNTLYIANNSNIYSINTTLNTGNDYYNLTLNYSNVHTKNSVGTTIKSIYYTDADPNTNNDYLHYITNNSYNIINLKNKSISLLSNIVQTNATDSLSLVTDFVIDNNYEIGYIAFEKRLKWFYNI
jgi:hypothetical protein